MKPTRKIGRRADRFLTHNERGCTGRHCVECTPSSTTPAHRRDGK